MNIAHFHNGKGGGVLSVIRNLLAYQQNLELQQQVIYTVNSDEQRQYAAPQLLGAVKEQVFYYSPKSNFYHSCNELAKLLPSENTTLVAHDWLELGLVSNLGLPFPVVQFVHGDYDYYYNLAVKHEPWIDAYICVSASIADKLKQRLPQRSESIHYLRFPVPAVQVQRTQQQVLQVVFAGRCERAKGYHLLPIIQQHLQEMQVYVQWHIVGEGSDETAQQECWPTGASVTFYGKRSQEEVYQLFAAMDVLILPSLAEGMPVVVVEAMKAGAVPVVNNLPGGMQELIEQGKTGYRIDQNTPLLFTEKIAELDINRAMLQQVSAAAQVSANKAFDPVANAKAIEDCILLAATQKKPKPKQKMYGSRLDHPLMPNFLTRFIRNFTGK